MRNEQNIGFVMLAMLLAFSMPATQARRAAPRLDAVWETLAEALTCTDADPRACTIRTLP